MDTTGYVVDRAPACVGLYDVILRSGRETIMDYHPWTSKEDHNTGDYLDYGDVAGWRRIPGQRYRRPE